MEKVDTKPDYSVDSLLKILGVNTIKELSEMLNIPKTTIEKWGQRGVPSKIWRDYGHNVQLNIHTIKVPKLSPLVGAGGGHNIEAIDSIEQIGELVLDVAMFKTTPPKKLFAMQVDGYSMTPMVFPDSLVIFDDTTHFRGDGLYVINWRNTLMVKLLQVNGEGKMRIIAVNKDYESYTIDIDDQSVFKIFGKVIRTII